MGEAAAQSVLRLESPIELVEMRGEGRGHVARVRVQHGRDTRQWQPEPAQGADAIEPLDVVVAVDAVPAVAATRGRDEPDLVVVVQRAHGQPGCPGQVADSPTVVVRGHAADRKTSRCVRCNS